MSEQEEEEIRHLQNKPHDLLTTAVNAGEITPQKRLVIEQRFRLNAEQRQTTLQEIATQLQITDSRSRAMLLHALRRLRRSQLFVQTMNAYFKLVPYRFKTKRPYWLAEDGSLKPYPI